MTMGRTFLEHCYTVAINAATAIPLLVLIAVVGAISYRFEFWSRYRLPLFSR